MQSIKKGQLRPVPILADKPIAAHKRSPNSENVLEISVPENAPGNPSQQKPGTPLGLALLSLSPSKFRTRPKNSLSLVSLGKSESEKPDSGPFSTVGSNAARYKAMSPAKLPISRATCLTIPPGLSPTSLLESPVLLSNIKVCLLSFFLSAAVLLLSALSLSPPLSLFSIAARLLAKKMGSLPVIALARMRFSDPTGSSCWEPPELAASSDFSCWIGRFVVRPEKEMVGPVHISRPEAAPRVVGVAHN
ncbi:hypothetical protein ACLOJK_035730 [Asimina triloba]